MAAREVAVPALWDRLKDMKGVIVGSAVGGIPDQIAPGRGLLLDDPADVDEFGRTLRALLADPVRIEEMGAAAHNHIRQHFVGNAHLLRWIAVVGDLLD